MACQWSSARDCECGWPGAVVLNICATLAQQADTFPVCCRTIAVELCANPSIIFMDEVGLACLTCLSTIIQPGIYMQHTDQSALA